MNADVVTRKLPDLPKSIDEATRSHEAVLVRPRPLRILHCIGSFGGGGAERQLTYLSRQLKEEGVEVHIAYLRGGPNLSPAAASGARLHELSCRSNYDPLLLWRLIKLMRSIKPDLVQTWLMHMDILGGLAALLAKTPFLLTERSAAPAYRGTWKAPVRSWIGRRAAMIVANSESGREYWLPKKVSAIKVIRNSVPVEEIIRSSASCSVPQEFGKTPDILLFAGRYSPEKNVETLLDAIFSVISKRGNTVALFFGEGPLQKELAAKIDQRNMQSRVKVREYTPQLWSWMKRAALFVSVSLFEGSPNAILEAAAQGCPLVLSDIPQHREIFSDEMAFFVSPFVSDEIAHQILRVLGDPRQARRKAEAARQQVYGHTVHSVAREYMTAYGTVCARSQLAKA